MSEKVRDICIAENSVVHSGWQKDIEDVLLLLKLLPTKVKRQTKKLHYEPILEVFDRLIIFASVSEIRK